jgi:hypothetical protein
MTRLSERFEERLAEVEEYLDFLSTIERVVGSLGPGYRSSRTEPSPRQQKILYAGVYLQLYNLVEATVTFCLEELRSQFGSGSQIQPEDLSEGLFQEWFCSVTQVDDVLSREARRKKVISACRNIIRKTPVKGTFLNSRRGGNWDDREIETLARRLGLKLNIPDATRIRVKRPIQDDKGALTYVKDLRNRLAHGGIAFSECAAQTTVADLTDLKKTTAEYLRQVVGAFDEYICQRSFLRSSEAVGTSA